MSKRNVNVAQTNKERAQKYREMISSNVNKPKSGSMPVKRTVKRIEQDPTTVVMFTEIYGPNKVDVLPVREVVYVHVGDREPEPLFNITLLEVEGNDLQDIFGGYYTSPNDELKKKIKKGANITKDSNYNKFEVIKSGDINTWGIPSDRENDHIRILEGKYKGQYVAVLDEGRLYLSGSNRHSYRDFESDGSGDLF